MLRYCTADPDYILWLQQLVTAEKMLRYCTAEPDYILWLQLPIILIFSFLWHNSFAATHISRSGLQSFRNLPICYYITGKSRFIFLLLFLILRTFWYQILHRISYLGGDLHQNHDWCSTIIFPQKNYLEWIKISKYCKISSRGAIWTLFWKPATISNFPTVLPQSRG
jgi:hypothetical protein